MSIKLSALPPDVQRLVLQQAGRRAPARRKASKPIPAHLERVCSCLFEMFRPDGNYPDECPGCGRAWPRPD